MICCYEIKFYNAQTILLIEYLCAFKAQEGEVMNAFIHTFSMVTKITYEELMKLRSTYQNIFPKGKKYILGIYAKNGLRLEIKQCKEIECRMDKEHRFYKVNMIFTLYKLLHPDESMGMLREEEELREAVKEICRILNEIYEQSGVDLLNDAKVKRVDVTVDAVTPSDTYTKEIIRIAKKILLPYGYKFWEPSDDEREEHLEWDLEDAVFYNNHNQEIQAKVYNKKNDNSVNEDFLKELSSNGYVRFELTLKRGFLKKHGYINKTMNSCVELAAMLIQIMKDSDMLISDYIGETLGTGDILSKNILKKYIMCSYNGKTKRINNMLCYMELVNNNPENLFKYGSDAKIRTVQKNFEELGVSPFYSKAECPYIPDYDSLLRGAEPNQKLLNMTKQYNKKRKHECEYWV